MEPSLLTIYPQKNLKGSVTWALLSISADWIGCYTKYLIFKDTRWTEILHVVGEVHSAVLLGRTVSLLLMEKNEWVCLICIEGRPSLMKIKASFYIKNCFDNYHETTRKKKKCEKQKKSKDSCETLLSSVFFFRLLHPSSFLKLAKWT